MSTGQPCRHGRRTGAAAVVQGGAHRPSPQQHVPCCRLADWLQSTRRAAPGPACRQPACCTCDWWPLGRLDGEADGATKQRAATVPATADKATIFAPTIFAIKRSSQQPAHLCHRLVHKVPSARPQVNHPKLALHGGGKRGGSAQRAAIALCHGAAQALQAASLPPACSRPPSPAAAFTPATALEAGVRWQQRTLWSGGVCPRR